MKARRQRQRILIVDHDSARSATLAAALRRAGYAVHLAGNALTGLMAVEQLGAHLVILNWRMPFVAGATFVYALRVGLTDAPPVIALDETGDATAALAVGAQAALDASADPERVAAAVDTLLSAAGRVTALPLVRVADRAP
jgi:two-component system, OmpR family, response regulator